MNFENPKVTVRMSAYNHELFVEQAILSIINQTYQDFELLVIDDGSSDRTPEILERLSQAHGFYFERQDNMGAVPTINKIAKMARGEYFTGCASDDFWPPYRLEEQVEALESNPTVALVHGIPSVVDMDGMVVVDERFQLEQMLDGESAFADMVWRRKKFQTTTVMVRSEVYCQLGGYDESIAVEDVDWMLRVTRHYPIKAIGRVWSFYRKHGENWTLTAPGGRRLIRAERQVAKKLGGRAGAVFLFTGLPVWFQIARRSNLPSRYFYLLLLPLYFWHTPYLKQLGALVMRKFGSGRGVIG